MSSISHQSIEQRLETYHIGLTNARDVTELQSRLAVFGYTPHKLNQLLALYQEVFDLYMARANEYSEQLAATHAFQEAWHTAHTDYIRLVKLGRIILKDDYAAYVKLTLNEERKKSFSGWLTQARTFFNALLADSALLAQYDRYGSDQDAIQAAFALVQAAEQANTAKVKETGEAQQATQERDARLDVLDSNMSEFYSLARLACEDAPQLLEMLGITVKSE
ncbi:hypothetical protein [Candidatus Electrothrix sp.]|uniref:hypothetical protein n=1 Tax=Candidatus Electrothrix sp. TaxID=2170559 RepID=UPI0040572AD4